MRTLYVAIMLTMVGLYASQGWAQESGNGPTVSVFDHDANAKKPLAGNAPSITKSENADNQPANKASASNEPSGPMSTTDKIVARFMALDTDVSGGVSLEEYMNMVQTRATARYATMDLNHDGEVTNEEYHKFWKLRMAQWYRLKR